METTEETKKIIDKSAFYLLFLSSPIASYDIFTLDFLGESHRIT